MSLISCMSWAQCSIAAFKGLLPSPHNEILMDLLFLLCNWHALAKLRIHHDLTLEMLDRATMELASQFRKFETETCRWVPTVELQREVQARVRRAAGKVITQRPPASNAQAPTHGSNIVAAAIQTVPSWPTAGNSHPGSTSSPLVLNLNGSSDKDQELRSVAIESDTILNPQMGVQVGSLYGAPPSAEVQDLATAPESSNTSTGSPNLKLSRRKKHFTLTTPKYHALGHYAEAIRRFGTTDSFTSEIVSGLISFESLLAI